MWLYVCVYVSKCKHPKKLFWNLQTWLQLNRSPTVPMPIKDVNPQPTKARTATHTFPGHADSRLADGGLPDGAPPHGLGDGAGGRQASRAGGQARQPPAGRDAGLQDLAGTKPALQGGA